jgi:hypothetical protein
LATWEVTGLAHSDRGACGEATRSLFRLLRLVTRVCRRFILDPNDLRDFYWWWQISLYHIWEPKRALPSRCWILLSHLRPICVSRTSLYFVAVAVPAQKRNLITATSGSAVVITACAHHRCGSFATLPHHLAFGLEKLSFYFYFCEDGGFY